MSDQCSEFRSLSSKAQQSAGEPGETCRTRDYFQHFLLLYKFLQYVHGLRDFSCLLYCAVPKYLDIKDLGGGVYSVLFQNHSLARSIQRSLSTSNEV